MPCKRFAAKNKKPPTEVGGFWSGREPTQCRQRLTVFVFSAKQSSYSDDAGSQQQHACRFRNSSPTSDSTLDSCRTCAGSSTHASDRKRNGVGRIHCVSEAADVHRGSRERYRRYSGIETDISGKRSNETCRTRR